MALAHGAVGWSAICDSACADSMGGQGVGENFKNIGFLSNTGPDSLKITMLPIQHLMLDGPLMLR